MPTKSSKNFFQKYPLLIVGFIVLIFATIILFITALNLNGTSEIELLVAPASASVTIDGKAYQNGTFRIPSGTHTIKIEKDNFNSKEFTFDTGNTDKIYAYILESDGSYNWYLNHSEDALILTSIGDYEAALKAENYAKTYQISSILPIIYANYDEQYNYTEYRIDGGSFTGCNSDFCLKITDTTGGNYDAAKQKIEDAGFNPDDYQILYEYIPIENL